VHKENKGGDNHRVIFRLGTAGAIEKQLDQLETIFNAFIVAVLIVFFASANADKTVQLFGSQIETGNAHVFVVLVFDCIFLLFCHLVWKIRDLIRNFEPDEAEKSRISLLTRKWLLNPFSFCGAGETW
jgi:Na+/phosphate symporter